MKTVGEWIEPDVTLHHVIIEPTHGLRPTELKLFHAHTSILYINYFISCKNGNNWSNQKALNALQKLDVFWISRLNWASSCYEDYSLLWIKLKKYSIFENAIYYFQLEQIITGLSLLYLYFNVDSERWVVYQFENEMLKLYYDTYTLSFRLEGHQCSVAYGTKLNFFTRKTFCSRLRVFYSLLYLFIAFVIWLYFVLIVCKVSASSSRIYLEQVRNSVLV